MSLSRKTSRGFATRSIPKMFLKSSSRQPSTAVHAVSVPIRRCPTFVRGPLDGSKVTKYYHLKRNFYHLPFPHGALDSDPTQPSRTANHGRRLPARPRDGDRDSRPSARSSGGRRRTHDAPDSRGKRAAAAREGRNAPRLLSGYAAQRRAAFGDASSRRNVLQWIALGGDRRAAR